MKLTYHWEGDYLIPDLSAQESPHIGIEQNDAHRAWCDAEANVGVYFKLKEIGE